MQIEIISAKVLLTNGCDKVILKTKLLCPIIPEGLPSQPDLELYFDATHDTGEIYCLSELKITPEIINVR